MNWTIILQCFDVSTSRGILEHEWLTFLNRAMIRPCLCKTSATQWWKTYFSRKTRTLSYIFDFYAWNSDLQGHYFKIHLDSVRKVLNVSWVESWNSNTVQSHVWDLIFDLNVYAIRFHLKHVALLKLSCVVRESTLWELENRSLLWRVIGDQWDHDSSATHLFYIERGVILGVLYDFWNDFKVARPLLKSLEHLQQL